MARTGGGGDDGANEKVAAKAAAIIVVIDIIGAAQFKRLPKLSRKQLLKVGKKMGVAVTTESRDKVQ
jgi:hypothetical protein